MKELATDLSFIKLHPGRELTTVSKKVLMEVIQFLPDLIWAGAVLSQLKVKKHVNL